MPSKVNPKIIILGIDGLEYNLVKEWRLKNIMQKAYCKMDLSDYKVVVTPPIWGSMLTGKIDEEVMEIWIKQAQITGHGVNVEQKWWAKLGQYLPLSVAYWIENNILSHIIGGDPFETTANYVLDKKQPNIFEFFENPWTNGIPSYGRKVITEKSKKLLEDAIGGEQGPYRKLIMDQYKDDKNKLFSILKSNDYDLIFWYTTLIDNFGHMDIGKPIKMMKHYLEINELVGKVKDNFPKSIIYILSDHGMDRMEPKKNAWGIHSDHAFFSSNTGEKIGKPTQFYDLVSKNKVSKK